MSGKEFCSRAIPGPGPSQNSALSGPPPPKCRHEHRQGIRGTGIPRIQGSFLPPYAAQLRVGPVPNTSCADKLPRKCSCLFLQGTAEPWFNLAAIPPGTVSFLLCARSSRQSAMAACDAAARARQKHHRAFRASRKQPFRLLAQRMSGIPPLGSDRCPVPTGVLPATPCAGTPASAALALCFYSWVTASELGTGYPARTFDRAHSLGLFQPKGREAVCPPHRSLSLSAAGSLRSPVRCPAKASAHPTLPDRLSAQTSATLRGLGHCQTCKQRLHPGHQRSRRHLPRHRACLQDCQQSRLTGKPTLPGQCVFERPTTPKDGARVYIYTT